MIALVHAGTVTEVRRHLRPWYDTTLERWWDLRDPLTRADAGWLDVTETPRPDLDPTETFATPDHTVELLGDGTPYIVWNTRPKTPAELDADTERAQLAANRATARAKVADLTTYLAQSNPNTAQKNQLLDTLAEITRHLLVDLYR